MRSTTSPALRSFEMAALAVCGCHSKLCWIWMIVAPLLRASNFRSWAGRLGIGSFASSGVFSSGVMVLSVILFSTHWHQMIWGPVLSGARISGLKAESGLKTCSHTHASRASEVQSECHKGRKAVLRCGCVTGFERPWKRTLLNLS